ncbi:hypothetical protein AAZX31_10G253500 [Glycine max]|uniref:RRM domain-containing protein n=1 Tax=Glycine max TaxID=3847 RepID=I1LEP1_SOYBN|nr:serine/arginine-rich splicing factor SR45a [Glycine max]XP_028182229.1 serine/arginine-rich splicing factor SR45a-like [Glycine soja]KAH1140238.1 hypothetical protein GYH30_029238 [Glycine max]KAH1140239.1 hypothetical protein GYH30_029238 [Glycine max]KHN06726.1 Putative RNA-binding protein C25G10.01 [Glycine soja]KRH35824.1 hypothetical protein GLYMA_10G267100v4 [Glycine max]KRH35825.1 hypothetical protein GLYMA_10G267100v4 [Glycine max]|eukprot:XP_003536651.1 serine/arginine-rich splicing factor SR45a [Glycine max]
MSSAKTPRSASPSPVRSRRSRSKSLSRSRRSRSRSQDSADVENPGNNLYVTGLSTRITDSDLHKYFSKEGKVVDCHLVKDPHTKESRGFGFVTMETNDDAECCIKYLNRSVFEGRLITVEKAKRNRGRTPTPGKYCGPRDKRGQGGRRSHSYSPKRWQDRGYHSRDRRGRSRSPYHRRVEDYSDTHRRQRD